MKPRKVLYKPNNYTAAIMFSAVAAVMFCIAYITEQLLMSLLITTAVFITLWAGVYLQKRIISIEVDPQEKNLTLFIQIIFTKRVIQFPLNEVVVTYGNEVGARGIIRPSLRIYQENKLLFDVVPGITGWANDTLKAIVEHVQTIKAS